MTQWRFLKEEYCSVTPSQKHSSVLHWLKSVTRCGSPNHVHNISMANWALHTLITYRTNVSLDSALSLTYGQTNMHLTQTDTFDDPGLVWWSLLNSSLWHNGESFPPLVRLCKELAKDRCRLQLPHEKLSSCDVIGCCAIARSNFAGPQLRRSFSLDPVVWQRERVWVMSIGQKKRRGSFWGWACPLR